jgi:hypothetical protein
MVLNATLNNILAISWQSVDCAIILKSGNDYVLLEIQLSTGVGLKSN